MNTVSRTFWTQARIKRISLALIFAIFSAFCVTFIQGIPQDSDLKEGDFIQFYTVGVLMNQHRPSSIYDAGTIQKIENTHWPSLKGGYVLFRYPPFAALFLSPLARLSPLTAKIVFTLILGLFLFFSVYFAESYARTFKAENALPVTAFVLWFAPVFVSLMSGQLSVLCMFFYSAALRSFYRNTRPDDFLCGVWLGLWLFKPQFSGLFPIFFALSGSWMIVGGILVTALILWGMGVIVMGPLWPFMWCRQVFQDQGMIYDWHSQVMISFTGVFKALGRLVDWGQKEEMILNGLGYGIALAFLFFICVLFWRAGQSRDSGYKRESLRHLLFLAGPAVILISPHSLYYDMGILIFSLAPYLSLKTDRAVHIFLGLMILIWISTFGLERFGIQPLFFFVLGSFFYILRNSGLAGSLTSNTFLTSLKT